VQGCEEKRAHTRITEATAMDPENLWFCSAECERVHRHFEPLVRNTVLPYPRTIEVVGTSGRKRGVFTVHSGRLTILITTCSSPLRRHVGDSMQADAALRILRGSFEPLIMDNDRCGVHCIHHDWDSDVYIAEHFFDVYI
jgi:hypothetical protein